MIKNNIKIYGFNPIKEAINSNFIKILIIYINYKKIKKYKNFINYINNKKIPIKIIKNKNILYNNIFNKKNINDQGIIADIKIIKEFNLKDIINKKNNKIILILYNITDTRNIGSIIRTSACFYVDFIIIPNNYYIYNPNIIKISSGAIFKIPICRIKNLEQSIIILKKNNINIISITEKGNKNISNYLYKKNKSIALILGNEEKGIPQNILNISKEKLYIPINKKKLSSLNVSIACGIILYEINKNLLF